MTAAGLRSGPPSNPASSFLTTSDRLARLLERLQASAFEDLRGAEVSGTFPISERLLNESIRELLPASAPVRELHVAPRAGDRFDVRARLGSSSLLPALKLSVVIERQPDLPTSAVLVLKLELGALASFAGPALRFLPSLPPGIRLDGDRVHVDVAALLAARGLGEYMRFVRRLEVHTIDGGVVAAIDAAVR